MLNTIFIAISFFISIITARHMVSIHGARAISNGDKELLHDYILNFIGALLGWGAAYYFIFFRLGNTLQITDLLIILVSYIGITGWLPHIIINKGFKP